MSTDHRVSGRQNDEPREPRQRSTYVTHRLVRDGHAWVYQPSKQPMRYFRLMIRVGYGFFGYVVLALLSGKTSGFFAHLWLGVLLTLIGHAKLSLIKRCVRFDPHQRKIDIPAFPWFVIADPAVSQDREFGFDEVAGIEIVRERLSGRRYPSTACTVFGLKLVMKGGRRIHLIAHPYKDLLLKEADILSKMMRVSLRHL